MEADLRFGCIGVDDSDSMATVRVTSIGSTLDFRLCVRIKKKIALGESSSI
jgi:hypothetical protein